jgi:hypothetical protein
MWWFIDIVRGGINGTKSEWREETKEKSDHLYEEHRVKSKIIDQLQWPDDESTCQLIEHRWDNQSDETTTKDEEESTTIDLVKDRKMHLE